MVVQPLGVTFGAEGPACSAWRAIEARQRRPAASYLLVAQPEHARLSGELAAKFTSSEFPTLSAEVIEAIGAHDEGWSRFPGECYDGGREPMLTDAGKPRSFIEFPPADFVRAWSGSIDHATSLSAIGGVLVSRHFASLAEHSLRTINHPAADATLLRDFLAREQDRQRDLLQGSTLAAKRLEDLLGVLQFCDLLSLALCCGVTEPVAFPQCFGGKNVQMRCDDGAYDLSPSPFQRQESEARAVKVTVRAMAFPGGKSQALTYVVQ